MSEETTTINTSQETLQTTASLDLDKFLCGYMIAIDEENKFDFRVFGKRTGAVELLGLHEIANIRLHEPFERDKLAHTNAYLEKIVKLFNELLTEASPPSDQVK
jgi:hypothetical protein